MVKLNLTAAGARAIADDIAGRIIVVCLGCKADDEPSAAMLAGYLEHGWPEACAACGAGPLEVRTKEEHGERAHG